MTVRSREHAERVIIVEETGKILDGNGKSGAYPELWDSSVRE